MSSHGAHLGIRDKIKIYAMPKAICNRPFYFTRKIGFGLSTFYTHFHKWLTFNIVTEALARHDQANFCFGILQLKYYLYVINAKFYYFRYNISSNLEILSKPFTKQPKKPPSENECFLSSSFLICHITFSYTIQWELFL